MRKIIFLELIFFFVLVVWSHCCFALTETDKQLSNCVKEGQTIDPKNNISCCKGLKPNANYKLSSGGSCAEPNGLILICLKCGDGVCGKRENGCNCPQDCKDFKCKGAGEIPNYTHPADDMSIQCCKGLKHRAQKEYFNWLCQEQPVGGYYGICLSCGDGICDKKLESRCNCPEDCK